VFEHNSEDVFCKAGSSGQFIDEDIEIELTIAYCLTKAQELTSNGLQDHYQSVSWFSMGAESTTDWSRETAILNLT